MTTPGRPPVFFDLVEEHFDELDFLWEHREANVFTPDWTLRDLGAHEERAEAHLDGLRLAELHAVDLAEARMKSGTSAATAASLVLLESGVPRGTDVLLDTLRAGDSAVADGIRIGLRHSPVARSLFPALREIAAGAPPIAAAAATDVLAFHRQSSRASRPLFTAEDPWCRRLAFGAAGRRGTLSEEELDQGLQDPEASVRRAALRAAAHCGLKSLPAQCKSAAARGVDPDPEAVYFLGVLDDPQSLPLLQSSLARPDVAAAAVAGLGALGRVAVVPLLLDLMSDKKLGVVAVAAYRRLTAAGDVEGERPSPAPGAEVEDEEEGLPPDPVKARADWERRASRMSTDRAWQSGIPLADTALPEAFDDLPLESRRDVHLRLRARGTGEDLELEAQARHQRRA